MIYDYIIVGGGLSGLYSCYKLLKNNPRTRILLLEGKDKLGGRCETIKFKDNDDKLIQYEAGGARFSYKHKRVISLLKELKLLDTKIKISNTTEFITYPEHLYSEYKKEFPSFDSIISRIKNIIKKENISNLELRNTTLFNIIKKYCNSYYPISEYKKPFHSFIFDYFSYWSETNILNSLDALSIFNNEFNNNIQYYILKNGYSSIINKLLEKCKKYSGFYIKTQANVEQIECNHNDKLNTSNIKNHICYTVTYDNYKYNTLTTNTLTNKSNNKITIECNNVILAIPILSLKKIKFVGYNQFTNNASRLNTLITKYLQTEPLYRIYARYPNYYFNINEDGSKTKINKVWFHNIKKVSSNIKLKFIIPVNLKTGLIMVSYTDGDIAKKVQSKILTDYNESYNSITNHTTIYDKINQIIKDDLSKLFPNKSIPEPLWIKHHYWTEGAAYWKPSLISTKNISIKPVDYSKYLGIKLCNLLNNNIPRTVNSIKRGKVFLVGENISVHQAWIEGCLQSVDDCFTNFIKNNTTSNNIHIYSTTKLKKGLTIKQKGSARYNNKNTKTKKISLKSKTYTLTEVSKHNKKTDAWIVIKNKVYDITNWIPKHPGGNIIMKGVGKDATELYTTLHSHGVFASKVLKKYYIGKLVN